MQPLYLTDDRFQALVTALSAATLRALMTPADLKDALTEALVGAEIVPESCRADQENLAA
jgi:uncharacterized MnhB-related membrane protein